VLAAVIEIASGQDYEAFLREQFFEPAGMERTGHYALARRFPPAEVAVGLGGNVWGEVNSPANWGETSWLVLGSGGMVSTPRDLWRWRRFLRSGEAFGAAAQRKYGVGGVFIAEGGNDRGFINTIGAHGDTIVIVCSNSHVAMDDFTARIANAVAQLGTGE
jgi:CubicO group peptidase (beta-lactamase class C family)